MKQSTWPYFQRENELCAMRNSTRREATSGGLRRRRRDRERRGGHGHGVRVVRLDDVGPELPDHARQPPGRGQVDLVRRRQRNQVEPFGHALEQLALGVRHERRPLVELAQAEHRVHHLALAAAPRRAVSMCSENIEALAAVRARARGALTVRCSSHSLANFRNTE